MATSQSLPERGEGIVSKLRPGSDTEKFEDWLARLEDLYKNPGEDKSISNEAYAAIGTSLKHVENAIDAINKKEIFQIVEAGVILVANIASLAGSLAGINLAWVLPVCKIFLGIAGLFVSRSEQKTESVLSQIKRTIKKELTDFKFEMLGEEISRVMRVGELMAMDLNHFLSNSKACELYKGFSEISRFRLDELYLCMGNLKDIARKNFLVLKEESTDVKIGSTYALDDVIPTKSKILEEDTESQREGHAKQCLMCLTAYCDLATIYIMLLSQHKILSHTHKHATDLIDIRLEKIFDEANEFLAFLPDREMLAPIGWWEGKLRVMYNYRKTPNYYSPIKRFLGMIGLPETCYSIEEAKNALDVCLSLAAYKVPALEPVFLVSSFYFASVSGSSLSFMCLLNNTRWPVCIFSGLEANNLRFEVEVPADGIHTHPCCDVKDNTSFSSAGIITVGERKQPLSDMGYVQYIEFALSNSTVLTKAKKKIYTNPVDCNTRSTLYESYKANLQSSHDKAKSFTYDGQFCIVKGEIQLRGGEKDCQKFTLYQFVIEEFDHDKLKQRTMIPFAYYTVVYEDLIKRLIRERFTKNLL